MLALFIAFALYSPLAQHSFPMKRIFLALTFSLLFAPLAAEAKCYADDRKELIKHAFEVFSLRRSPSVQFDTQDGGGEDGRKRFFGKVFGFKPKSLLEIHADLSIVAWDAENKKRSHLGVAELEFDSVKAAGAVVGGRHSYAGGRMTGYYVADTYNRSVFIVFSETPKDKQLQKFISMVPEMVAESCGALATRPFRDY